MRGLLFVPAQGNPWPSAFPYQPRDAGASLAGVGSCTRMTADGPASQARRWRGE